MSDGKLVQTMQRLMSIHDEIDALKDDLKTVYADAKSAGFDKSAIGLAIREIRGRAKAEKPDAQERAAIVELYVSAFDNAPRTYVHVPAREEAYPERVSRSAKIATPDILPSVQSEAEAGASPEQEASKRAAGGGEIIAAAQDAPFVTQAGAGEGTCTPDDPAPAADANTTRTSPAYRPRPSDAELEIPAFLRRTAPAATATVGEAL